MFRFSAAFAVTAIVGTLAGCTLGIGDSQSPQTTFTADVPYQRALRTADQQARECLRGKDAYGVVTTEDTAAQSGLVRVTAPFTHNDIARVEIKGDGASRSNVHIVMWGRGIWNQAAIAAMRDAVIYSVTSCTSYMPSEPAKH